jgi:hypothetical protein
MTLLNLQIIELLENLFEELESVNDCHSESSGEWQSAKYCDKLVNWREEIDRIKTTIKRRSL